MVARLPLLPAAVVACAIAAPAASTPLGALALGLLLALGCGALALASADRPRRLGWRAAALTALVVGLRSVVDLTPSFDLRDLPPLAAARGTLAAPLERLLPEPEAGLALGIVLGERASIGPDLRAAFNVTGTTHLLAISGYNLTLVAAAAAILTRRLRPALRVSASLLAVLAYSLVVGLQPSVLRALLMATVGALAVATGRRGVAANALAAAVALMLALDPTAIGQAGFLLSVAATAGLIAWQRPLAVRLAPLPALLGEGLAATLAATLPTLPLIAAIFGRISLVSPFANVVAVPLFAPLLATGALVSAIGAVSLDAARPFAIAAYLCAAALRLTVETFSAVPGAAVRVPDGTASGIAVAGLTIAGALAARCALPAIAQGLAGRRAGPAPSFLRRPGFPRARALLRVGAGTARLRPPPLPGSRAPRALLVALALVLAVGLGAAASLVAPRGPAIRVLALDVGQGDAFLIETDGKLALVDGGPDPTRLLAELGSVLAPWRRRVDLLVLTHAHLDHGAGLLAVLDRYTVGLAIEPVGLNEGPLATEWTARIARSGTARRAVRAGDRIRLGAATLAVLSPDGDPRVDVPSLVLRLERGSFSMLFSGDATEAAQADLLLRPEALATRVYVPPHHGAATPYAAALVRAAHPEAAVLSVGALNRYGHPAPETLAALGTVSTYRTDRDGTVEIASDGHGIGIRPHANGLPPPRRGSLPHAPPPR